jgi:hypothetical protein
MRASILHRLIALSAIVTAAACGPVQATSATRGEVGPPQWLDQTIYRPDCPVLEYDRDCRVDRREPE